MSVADDPAMVDFLVELSDTLVADLDADGLLHWVTERAVRLLSAQAAGIMVADGRGVLCLLAAAPEYTPRARLFEAPSAPASWCFATGRPAVDADLDDPDPRWAAYAEQARDDGFRSVAAAPMRMRGEIVGVLSVLRHRPGRFTDEELRLTQALANVATVGLLVQRDAGHRAVLAAQSQHVLTGRVAVERARGILAETFEMDVDTALDELRRHATRTGRSLRATAIEVVTSLPTADRRNGTVAALLAHPVTMASMAELRTQVRHRLLAAGLSGSALDSFLLAVHEATLNAQEHAGGGRLWLWVHHGSAWCEISDNGPGLPAGFEIPTGSQDIRRRHAGLWLIQRVCPDLKITSSARGTRLLLRRSLPTQPSGSPSAVDSGAGG
ncbi:GAF domain-containing protein [Actinoplanes sp. NPDC051475]|uniref:GAF domain-containing protein n=1 Tax=Actinoplanes sp. NPDC051475 TaxID=3157225 RepID=UPI0034507CF7